MNGARLSAKQYETAPQGAGGPRWGLSVARQAALALLIMILLVVAAGGIALWFSTSVQRSVQLMQQGTDQAIRVSDLELRWLAIAGTLDSISVTRPTPEITQQLNQQLAELKDQLFSLTTTPLGLSEEKIAENQQIAESLQQTGLDMTNMVDELVALVEEGRWGTAMQRRQSAMASIQSELAEDLNRLNQNLQSDVAAQMAEIVRLQSLARTFSLITVALGVLFSILVIWITRRTILAPLNKLIADVQMVSSARSAEELRPVQALQRRDEIGELSRAQARMIGWLRESYTELEKQVQERTAHLKRRTTQLEVSAQVARDIVASHDLETLLYQAVNTIRDRFDFYHAGIFLVDQRREYAILRSTTGEPGREMLERKHRLKVGETGLVGNVAQTGKARVASDVGQDAIHFKNPSLPETRSEAALPLKVGGSVIGVLDVQSRSAAAFDEESVATLQIVADQLAIAIQNARLLQESQESLRELETAYKQINQQAWEQQMRGAKLVGYEFDGVEARPIYRANPDEDPAAQAGRNQVPSAKPFQIPLRVRGEMVGSLDVWPEEGELSEAEVALLTSISNRLSQTLESARLYENAQRLARREQQINLIASHVRSSVNLETILQNTVRELGRSLGASRAFIQIGGTLIAPEAEQAEQNGAPPLPESPPARPEATPRGSNGRPVPPAPSGDGEDEA